MCEQVHSSQSTRHADDLLHYNTKLIDLTLELNSKYSDVKAITLLELKRRYIVFHQVLPREGCPSG